MSPQGNNPWIRNVVWSNSHAEVLAHETRRIHLLRTDWSRFPFASLVCQSLHTQFVQTLCSNIISLFKIWVTESVSSSKRWPAVGEIPKAPQALKQYGWGEKRALLMARGLAGSAWWNYRPSCLKGRVMLVQCKLQQAQASVFTLSAGGPAIWTQMCSD